MVRPPVSRQGRRRGACESYGTFPEIARKAHCCSDAPPLPPLLDQCRSPWWGGWESRRLILLHQQDSVKIVIAKTESHQQHISIWLLLFFDQPKGQLPPSHHNGVNGTALQLEGGKRKKKTPLPQRTCTNQTLYVLGDRADHFCITAISAALGKTEYGQQGWCGSGGEHLLPMWTKEVWRCVWRMDGSIDGWIDDGCFYK